MHLSLPTVDLAFQLVKQDGARRPLLLIHGALSTFEKTWREQIEAFSRQFVVIGPDLRGHGRSINRGVGLDLRQMADDLAHLLDHLQIDACNVCGFSGGASTALFLAQRHPTRVERLVLVSNNYQRDTARLAADFWNPDKFSAERLARLDRLHQHTITDLLRWWQAEDQLRPNFSVAQLAAIRQPALIVAGDRDPIIPLEQSVGLFRHLAHARLTVLPNTGHGAPYRRAQLFNTIALRFLTE